LQVVHISAKSSFSARQTVHFNISFLEFSRRIYED